MRADATLDSGRRQCNPRHHQTVAGAPLLELPKAEGFDEGWAYLGRIWAPDTRKWRIWGVSRI